MDDFCKTDQARMYSKKICDLDKKITVAFVTKTAVFVSGGDVAKDFRNWYLLKS